MKQLIILLTWISLPLLFSCGSKGSDAPAEDNLVVNLSATAIQISTSNSYVLTVNVTSKMPPQGVTVKVDVKREDNAVSVYSIQANSSLSSSNFTISPLPPGQIYCMATVTVTSVTKATNVWTGTFRVLWK
jgi:hypothetical protein